MWKVFATLTGLVSLETQGSDLYELTFLDALNYALARLVLPLHVIQQNVKGGEDHWGWWAVELEQITN